MYSKNKIVNTNSSYNTINKKTGGKKKMENYDEFIFNSSQYLLARGLPSNSYSMNGTYVRARPYVYLRHYVCTYDSALIALSQYFRYSMIFAISSLISYIYSLHDFISFFPNFWSSFHSTFSVFLPSFFFLSSFLPLLNSYLLPLFFFYFLFYSLLVSLFLSLFIGIVRHESDFTATIMNMLGREQYLLANHFKEKKISDKTKSIFAGKLLNLFPYFYGHICIIFLFLSSFLIFIMYALTSLLDHLPQYFLNVSCNVFYHTLSIFIS